MSSPYPYNTLFVRDRHIRIYDERYADTYDIFLDEDNEFDYATRWIDRVGFNPIHCDNLDELPIIHKTMVEDVIAKFKRKHSANRNVSADSTERKANNH